MSDPLCVCGHLADHHADPAIGDTRCLVVEDRRDLLDVFGDVRDGQLAGQTARNDRRPGECRLVSGISGGWGAGTR